MAEQRNDNQEDGGSWAPDVRVVNVPNFIKPKVGDGPAKLDNATAERIEARIAAERDNYLDLLDNEIKELRAIAGRYANTLDEEGLKAIFFIAHRIRGEAGMNDLVLVETIASLLCDCVEHPEIVTGPMADFIKLHIDALAAVRTANLSGSGGETGRVIIEGFKQARQKLTTQPKTETTSDGPT